MTDLVKWIQKNAYSKKETMIDVNSANTFLNSTLFSQIIFLLTGIFQTIGNQYETYSGAAGTTFFLLFFLFERKTF